MDVATFIYGVLFWLLSLVLIAAASLVVVVENPVFAVLFLILAFFNAAGLFLLAGAEFLSLMLVVVYVGAVAVLFLFVVMMLDIKREKATAFLKRYYWLGGIVGLVLIAEMLIATWAYLTPFNQVSQETSNAKSFLALGLAEAETSNIVALGGKIYTDYFLLFQLAGLILLVAMIAAILLTHRKRQDVKKQNISQQNLRKVTDDLTLITMPFFSKGKFLGRLSSGSARVAKPQVKSGITLTGRKKSRRKK